MTSYAADLQVGTMYELGRHHVTTEEMLEFATRWDPQPFHVDPEAASRSHFGRLIGSGLHSLAILQRLTVEAVFGHWAVIAGRRLRDIELTAPLLGGTTLTGTVTIEALEPQPARNRALVTTRGRLTTPDAQLLEAVFETYVWLRAAVPGDGNGSARDR